jgi:hypothetical protein
MWQIDPEVFRRLESIRETVMLQHQRPSREWPLHVLDAEREVFVVREWPNGSITGCTMPLSQLRTHRPPPGEDGRRRR